MLLEIEDERVIFIGEIHAKPSSHHVQLEVIKHLHESGRDVSIAIEIFPAAQQKYLNAWINDSISRDDFAKIFSSIANLPFSAYEEIFNYARQNKIAMTGIDAVRKSISDISKNGIKNVHADFLKKVKYSQCTEEPQYMEQLGFSGKRNYHETGMPHLCDGQRMRDSVMAFNLSRIVLNSQSTVVVMLGLVHASKIAVPGMLQKHTEVDYVVLMPEGIKSISNRNPALDVADYIWY